MSASAADLGAAQHHAHEDRASFGSDWWLLLVGLLLVEAALLATWQRNAYWDFSDGVYAMSAREFLHGIVPYRDFAAAQPPPVYVFGAIVLAVHDGLSALRLALGAANLITAALVAVCVWRLTGSRAVAIVAALAAPLLPISLHEHAQLTPETLAAPLILGGALCCAREERAIWGGALLALAAMCKVAFLLPAVAVIAFAARRSRAAAAFAVALLCLVVLSFLGFGTSLWREAIVAQLQLGRPSIHYAGGLLAQIAWNELPLVVGGAVAVWLVIRERLTPPDPPLFRVLLAASVAGLLLALTVFKRGSYINVMVVAEPPLLTLAACGVVWGWRAWPVWRVVSVILIVVLAAQSLSILANPSNPWVAKRPGAASGLNWSAGPGTVDAAERAARRCPAGTPYSGPPYLAFVADRAMPGNQPDLFMLAHAKEDAAFARLAAAAQVRCS